MEGMKVFEFAKEMGIETLLLMDKIREWKLPVKSHMATLDAETMSMIKVRLKEPAATEAPAAPEKKAAAKKTVAKKALESKPEKIAQPVVAKRTGAVKAVAPPEAVVVAPTKKVAKITADDSANTISDGPAGVALKKSALGAGVIRRKAADLQAAQQAALEAEKEAQAQAEREALEAQANAVSAVSDETTTAEAGNADAGVAATAISGAAVTPAPVVPSGPPNLLGDQQKRRNIVGKMDLSKARPPGAPGGTGVDGRGPRPQASGARNIRTGFFAAPLAMPEVENEYDAKQAKEREEKKKRPAAGGAKEEVVQTFNAADFRKREVIFQPKKKKIQSSRDVKKTLITTPKAGKRVLKIDKSLTVSELAAAMSLKAPLLVKKLMVGGVTANMNTTLDFDTISLLATEFDFEAQNVHKTSEELANSAAFGELKAETIHRPPVVTVMGHVDHGKTSLLDAIRSTNVASKEAGGITQHIGAYQVDVGGGKLVTFLDTPGHEAFTQMRARGANATDIAVIVVAADDGVMPQTAEAISHAKAAGVPLIIAVNKIDKPGAQVDRIKQQLTEFEIVPEEWGGSNIFCEVSALQKKGIQELLEQILLVAEVEDLKANPKRSATGVVIESKLEKGRGCVASLLVLDGTLSTGDVIVLGTVMGRVRGMVNDRGEQIQSAAPGAPVEIIGLPDSPLAGDRFDVVEDETAGEDLVQVRKDELHKPKATGKGSVSLEELFSKVQKGSVLEFNVLVKADVAGSLEALKGMLEKAGTSEVKTKIVHAHVGGVSESDVLLAATSGATILAFNVRPDTVALRTAKERQVEIRTYTIIYELLDDVKKAMAGLLKPISREVVRGRAEIREVFALPKVGNIAGCTVVDGKILRSDKCRLIRNGTIVYQGELLSLRRFKDDVKEVAQGYECGIGIENFNDIKPGDVIEAYVIELTAKEL